MKTPFYVYMVTKKKTGQTNGCFSTMAKAEKYINGNESYFVDKIEVA